MMGRKLKNLLTGIELLSGPINAPPLEITRDERSDGEIMYSYWQEVGDSLRQAMSDYEQGKSAEARE